MDVATLGLRLENGQAVAAATEFEKRLNALGATGDATSAKMKNLFTPAEQAMLKQQKTFRDFQRNFELLNGTANDGAKAMEGHSLATGKMIRALEGMSASAIGADHHLAVLGVTLSEFAAGHAAVLVALGVVAALGVAYEKLTEDAKKAREEQDKLTKSLEDWYRVKAAGGDAAVQIAAENKKIAEQTDELNRLIAKYRELSTTFNAKTGLRDESAMASVLTQINRITAAIEDGRRAITAKREDEDKATKATLDDLRLQIEMQGALNAAYSRDATVLDAIKARYAALADIQKFAADHTAEETRQYAALRMELLKLAQVSSQIEALERSQVALLDRLTASLEKTNVQWTINAQRYKDVLALANLLIEVQSTDLPKAAAKAAKSVEDQVNESANAVRAQMKHAEEMQTIFREGFEHIITHGTKSFQNFFDDILQMFSKLMDEMKKEADRLHKTIEEFGGATYKALGIGSAAIAGGVAGYQLGQQTGNYGVGVFGGAASGALIGTEFGPWGAAIGGLVGAAGGLLGASKAQAEAAKQLQQAALAARANVETYYAGAFGDSTAAKLATDAAKFTDLYNQVYDLFRKGGLSAQEAADAVAKLDAAHRRYTETITEEEARTKAATEFSRFRELQDVRLRLLHAQGLDDEARKYQELLEVQDAVNQGKSDEYVATLKLAQAAEDAAAAQAKAAAEAERAKQAAEQARQTGIDALSEAIRRLTDKTVSVLEAQTEILRKHLDVAKDAQHTAQDTLRETQQVVESLTKYRDSLLIGPQSPLSPLAQLNAARSQVESLFTSALGGNRTAGSNFGGAASQFLELSRGYNASGAAYVQDFQRVQAMTNQLLADFGEQQSIDQLALDKATQQVALLEQQIDATRQTIQEVRDAADRIIDALKNASGEQIAALQSNVATLNALAAQADAQARALAASTTESVAVSVGAGLAPLGGALASAMTGGFSGLASAFTDGVNAQIRAIQDLAAALGVAGVGGTTPASTGFGKGGITSQADVDAYLNSLVYAKYLTPADRQYMHDYYAAVLGGGDPSKVPLPVYAIDTSTIEGRLAAFLKNNPGKTAADFYAGASAEDIPGFASGGSFGGGFMRVGEMGAELVASGPARVHTSRDLNAPTVAELQALRAEMRASIKVQQAGFSESIGRLESLIVELQTNTKQTKRGFESVGGKL